MRKLWELAKAALAVVVWAAVIEILHHFGWFPEKWLADRATELVDATPVSLQQPVIFYWSLIAFLAAITLFAEHWIPPLVTAHWPRLRNLAFALKNRLGFGAGNGTARSGPTYLPQVDTELQLAIYQLAHRSAWGRWYAAQHLALSNGAIDDGHLMNIASHIVSDAAMNGHLVVRGRPSGSIEYESIPREHWRLVFLNVKSDPVALWRVAIEPCHGIDPSRIGRLLSYDSLLVNSLEFEKIWPMIDRNTDKARKKFLKAAKKKGADPLILEQLS